MMTFQEKYEHLLAQWGVKLLPRDKGTCVIYPSDWKSLTPTTLGKLWYEEMKKFPACDADRLVSCPKVLFKARV